MSKKANKLECLKEIMEPLVAPQLKFFGNKAMFEMDEDKVAEISLITGWTHGQYPKMLVVIQHKNNGEIARNSFVFEDYLEREQPYEDLPKMYIWQGMNNEYDWYIVRPKTTKPIVDAILKYIQVYSY